MRKKNDSDKALRTIQLIKDAFIDIFSNKKINSITIQEIMNKAGLNRGTFYIYFESIYDLLEEIEYDLLSELGTNLTKVMNRISFKEDITDIMDKFVIVLKYIKEKNMYYQTLLGKNGDPLFLFKFKQLMKQNLFKKFKIGNKPVGTMDDYVLEYISSAHIGLIVFWLETGTKISPEELTLLILKMAFKGPFNYLQMPAEN